MYPPPGLLSGLSAARNITNLVPGFSAAALIGTQPMRQPPFTGTLDNPKRLQTYLNSCPRELTSLELHDARIKTLQGIRFPPGLKELNLEQNQLTSLNGVQFPPGLTELMMNDNQIVSLSGVKFPRGLKRLDLSNNKIQSLSGAEFPPTLERLDLEGNPLSDLGYVDEGDDGRYTRLINPNKYVIEYLKRNFAQLYFRDLYDQHKESKIAEKLALKTARQSQKAEAKAVRQSQKETLKRMTDLSHQSMRTQMRAVTSFLREGMAARAQQHAEQLLRDRRDKPEKYEESLFYVKLGETTYPVPMVEDMSVQDVLDYLNEHYYISVLHNCGDMHLHKQGDGELEPGRTLKDCGVVSDVVLQIQCGSQTGGFRRSKKRNNKRPQKIRNKSNKKWT